MTEYPYEDVIETVCPLMDDLKTKIKIKTLDLLVIITIKTELIDKIKGLVLGKMNQVYYEMYCEKVSKELKNHPKLMPEKVEREEKAHHPIINRRYSRSKNVFIV